MEVRFDRGTILIGSLPGGRDPATLPGVKWDPRVRSWRAPASACGDVLARLGVQVPAPRPMDAVTAGPELRWYQREALAAWAAAGRRGVIALPTGAGKTVTAVAAIASCGAPALCLVPTRVLLDQWARVLARHVDDVGRLGDGERRVAPVTVATYASAVTWAPRIGDRFGLVVVDEAHHVGASCPSEVLEMLVAAARLGLTATPPVGDAAEALEQHVGPVVYALTVDDLVGDALAEFEHVVVPIELTADERRAYVASRSEFVATFDAFRRADPRATWEGFVAAAMRSEHGRRALGAWRRSRELLAYPEGKRSALRDVLRRHAGQRTLVFTPDNRTAYEIARELLVHPITHEIGRGERARVLERFGAGEIDVLVSAQVLDEGVDVPAAEIAVVVGGSASARRHVQRVGRVLRPAPGKRACVYELTVSGTVEVGQARRRQLGLYGAAMEGAVR